MRKKQDIGISRGGKNTNIHVLVDGLGNPIRLIFTSGEVHDSKQGVPLLEGFNLSGSAVLGDKAMGSIEILTYIRYADAKAVIPSKTNAKDLGTVITAIQRAAPCRVLFQQDKTLSSHSHAL